MRRLGSRAGLILAVIAFAVVALAATAAARTTSSKASADRHRLGVRLARAPMAPFDGPALAAAQLRVEQVNARGGVGGRPLADPDVRHAGRQACDRRRRAR